jgi:type I restriction enzyme S subunit
MKGSSWRACRLGDLLSVKHGFAFEGQYFGSLGTHIVLTPGNFHEQGGFRAKGDNEKWYGGPIPEDYVLQKGAVIVAMTEQAEGLLGSSAIVPRSGIYLHNQRLGLIQAQEGIADPQFLYHLFNVKTVRQQIRASASGVKIRHTAPSRIAEVTVTVPPLPLQRRIAGILSAYDALIENNLRRIQILEQIARALYREWFVEFRFVGHDGLRRKSQPNAWPIVPLKSLTTKIGSGATPRGGKAAYKDVGISLIRSLNVYDDHFDPDNLAFIDTDQAAGLDNVVVEERDILLNITGASVARCCMVPSHLLPARVNQHVMIVRVNPALADPFYVLDTINSVSFKKQLVAYAQGGATREALTKETVSNLGIPLPPCELLRRYGQFAQPLFQQRETLERQADNLRRTRDLLLPRLMSGQISVTEAAA